jgi:hypothetical protein
MKKSFSDVVREYSAWKLQEKGNGKVTRDELSNLREQFRKRNKPQIREDIIKLNNMLKERVAEYRKWKLKNKGTDKINEQEMSGLKKSILQEDKKPAANTQDWATYLKNYKQFKESRDGRGTKISYKELKLLKENFKEAQTRGVKLKEADMGAAPPPVQDPAAMGADPNAMGMDPTMAGNDPTAGMGTPQDPMAMQGAIDQAVAALQPFTQGGADPLGADPAAGIPPVAGADPAAGGMGVQDPAMGGQPMMEKMVAEYKAWKLAEKGTDKLTNREMVRIKEECTKAAPKTKYQEIKERIAARQSQIEGLQENSMGPLTVPQLANSNLWKHNKGNSTGASQDTAAAAPHGLANLPTAKQLAAGHSSGAAKGETSAAKTWPTKAMGKEAGGALQGAGASMHGGKRNEAEEDTKDGQLVEGVKTVTDVYVERHLEPKLNFDRIRESMKSGLLG